MGVILRRIGNYSFFFLLLFLTFIASVWLLNHILMRNVDKANRKIFQFNFASFFSLQLEVILLKDFIYSVAYSTVEIIIS